MRWVNLALLLVAALLTAAIVALVTGGASAAPGDARADTLRQRNEDAIRAARAETAAFLTIDYRNMDPLTTKVLNGATGPFRTRYARARKTLEAAARRSRAVATGSVLAVGVDHIDDSHAVLLIAADSQVHNTSTGGRTQMRNYRLKLDMLRSGDTWLTGDLKFVS